MFLSGKYLYLNLSKLYVLGLLLYKKILNTVIIPFLFQKLENGIFIH